MRTQRIQQGAVRAAGGDALAGRLRPADDASAAPREAIWFGRSEPLPARARVAWRLAIDEYQGQPRVQMVLEAATGVD